MTDLALSREFLLVAACCRRPLSDAVIASIGNAAVAEIDWPGLLRQAIRQRVVGLVHQALLAAKIEPPSPIAQDMAQRAQRIARENAILAAETVRLQRVLDTAGIPVVALKGAALAQLAYGSLDLKHTKDIDLLVPVEQAEAALSLLERHDYALALPAEHLNEAQRRAVIRYGKGVELVHRGGQPRVELQWRAALNSQLLKDVDAKAPSQDVILFDDAHARTLAEPDLFAYLCVHGAAHFWSRLKWLADLNALIAQKSEAELVTLYRDAQNKGAGLCAGQALLLCHRLLGLTLPAALAREFRESRRVKKLAAVALRAMTRPDLVSDRGMAGVAQGVFAQFRLGSGAAFFAEQCRNASVSIGDVVRLPLPPSLGFLYPLLRLPLWLTRRARVASRHKQKA